MKRTIYVMLIIMLLLSAVIACKSSTATPGGLPLTASSCPVPVLRIVAAPEIQILENIITGYTATTKSSQCPDGIPIQLSYTGAVDMKVMISKYASNNPGNVDLWWSASPIWTPGGYVQGQTSIMRTVTVFAMDPELASQLGWDKTLTHTMSEVLDGIRSGVIKLAMPSASQDDAGAMAYIASLSAIKGGPATLRLSDLQDPNITNSIQALFAAVNTSASRSDLLRTRFVNDRLSGNPQYNSLFISESMALAVNRDLVAKNVKPMQIYYLTDATAMSKFPIGYDKKANDAVKTQFAAFVAYLKSPGVQDKILALGFRTGDVGFRLDNSNPAMAQVFNSAWGIITDKDFQLISLPKDQVIDEAIKLYQTQFRKGSFTVFCLDFSPSMNDNGGHDQLIEAMKFILDQETAAEYSLQASSKDTIVVLPFSGNILAKFVVTGNDPNAFYKETGNSNQPYDPSSLMGEIYQQKSGSSTSIYGCALGALKSVAQDASPDQLTSIILMTDGVHNTPPDYTDLEDAYKSTGQPVPIYSIQFGSAEKSELDRMATLTNGAVCDGRGGQDQFIACFKLFKGN